METKYGVVLVAAVLIVLILGYYNAWFAPYWQPPTATTYTTPSGTTSTPITTLPVGTFTMKDVAYDSLDISTALTGGTDVDQSFWSNRGGSWILLGAHGASGTDIDVIAQDQGYIYVMCLPHSTSAYILDAAKVTLMNPRAVGVEFVDANGDSYKEFMVKWSMFNIPPAASGYPSSTFNGYYFAEDSASASIPAGGQPADITSISTNRVTKYLAWYVSLSAEKKALAVIKVEVKVNSTSNSKANLINVNVPGKGLIAGAVCDYQKTDTYQIWTYTIGHDISTATYWQVPAYTNNKFDLTAAIDLTLGSGDELVWTITVYELSAGQASVTDSDSVTTSE
jgi:hypothetical protein